MLVLEDNFNEKFKYPTYVALGSFDGIHLGHKSLIDKVIQLTNEFNCKNHNAFSSVNMTESMIHKAKSMVITFKNHPLTVINKEIAPKIIMDNESKIETLEIIGINAINLMVFNKEFMQISPEEFISKMVEYYNVKGIVVGFNYRFGYKNLGDVEMLKKYSSILGFDLHIMEPVTTENETISSSKIRHYISEGNVVKASELLGRPHMVKGFVVNGRKIGRTIGFPTINLNYDKNIIVPRGGVYYTNVEHNGKVFKGITNIGYNPTVEGEKLSVETNILDFSDEIYGQRVKIYFIERIRDEKKFNSIEELKAQLKRDKEYISYKNIK